MKSAAEAADLWTRKTGAAAFKFGAKQPRTRDDDVTDYAEGRISLDEFERREGARIAREES